VPKARNSWAGKTWADSGKIKRHVIRQSSEVTRIYRDGNLCARAREDPRFRTEETLPSRQTEFGKIGGELRENRVDLVNQFSSSFGVSSISAS